MEDATSCTVASEPSASELAAQIGDLERQLASWLEPTDDDLAELEPEALSLEAEGEVLAAEAALIAAIERLASAKAALLYLAYVGSAGRS